MFYKNILLIFLLLILGGCNSKWEFNPLSYIAKKKENNKFSHLENQMALKKKNNEFSYLEDQIVAKKAMKSYVDSATFNLSIGNNTWDPRGRCVHQALMENKALMCYAATTILSNCYDTKNSYGKKNVLEKFHNTCTDGSTKSGIS
jgi:hypothetical protein